jgi:hypothetical protein
MFSSEAENRQAQGGRFGQIRKLQPKRLLPDLEKEENHIDERNSELSDGECGSARENPSSGGCV